MKKIGIILGLAALIVSCSNTEEKETITGEGNTTETPKDVIKRGDEFSTEGAISTQDLAKLLETQDSAVVVLKGTVNAVCKKKGCWMTMPMNDEADLRVRFKDYAFFVPLNCEEKTAFVQGVAKKNIISVDELKHYAEDNGQPKEEIDAITQPEVEYSFLANGVVLE